MSRRCLHVWRRRHLHFETLRFYCEPCCERFFPTTRQSGGPLH